MFFKSAAHAIKQAFKQVFRNRAMTFASLFSITAMLLILGLFFILLVNVNTVAESAKSQFDTIQIYLLDETEFTKSQDMLKRLSRMDEVEKAVYLSKEEAMEEYKVKWGDKAYLLDGLSENPLPNSIRVEVKDIENADRVVEVAKTFEGVEDIKYYQTVVDKLIQITNFIEIGAFVVILFLIIISVVVVANTIKLTVLAREREISIMKYVGATNWFIRGPFLVEGMLIGFISAAISVGLIALIYKKILEVFGQDIFLMFSIVMVPEGFLIRNLVYIFMALGICIGAVGSIISMRRFLDT
ncbi:MAG: ABC transporter permease [Clostridiales bacterium]|nr:ABC transporter permease [Clostridiales bacterium]